MVRSVYPIFTPVTALTCASQEGYRLFTVGITYKESDFPAPRFFIRGTLSAPGDSFSGVLMWYSEGVTSTSSPTYRQRMTTCRCLTAIIQLLRFLYIL